MLCWIIFLCSLIPVSAQAYLYPSHFMIKKLVEHHGEYRSIRVVSSVEGVTPETAGIHFKDVTTYSIPTQILRTRIFNDTGTELYNLERNLSLSSIAEKKGGPLSNFLLLSTDTVGLIRSGQQKGLPIRSDLELKVYPSEEERRTIEATHLDRWDGKVFWVIGNKGESSLQLWLDKESFLPVRLIDSGADKWEIRYLNYKRSGEFEYPRDIVFLQADAPKLKVQIENLAINGEMKEPAVFRTGITSAGRLIDPVFQDTLRIYFSHVR